MNTPDFVTWHSEPVFEERPLLLHAFSGFVDAGSGVRLAVDHLLSTLDHQLIATFNPDAIVDYRARRPRMTYVRDHFASVDISTVTLHRVTDARGTGFLLLVGPEPDYQWQMFVETVLEITRRFDVRKAIGLAAIPWPIPHTRPLGVTVHGSEPALVAGYPSLVGEIEVPGHVGALLELRLGEAGLPSMGVTAQVPHYLVQFEYPRAAEVLLAHVSQVSGLDVPTAAFASAAAQAEAQVSAQMTGNDEFATVVSALEQQYDQVMSAVQPTAGVPLAPGGQVPSGDEIAAQVEAFLLAMDADDPKDAD
jgi:predicted ATP-grasp superfamily ATP-dependent carboligase